MNVKTKLARLSPVILAVAGSLLIAACGASSSSGSTHTSTTASTSGNRTKLVACLKQHGVTLPTRRSGANGRGFFGSGGPPAGGSGTTTSGSGTPPYGGYGGGGAFSGNSKFRTAFKDCGGKLGGFGAGAGRFRGRNFRPHFSTKILTAFVTCVRKHGYDIPKPNTSGRGPIFSRSIESNKKFQAASKSCASLLRPSTGTTSSTSSS